MIQKPPPDFLIEADPPSDSSAKNRRFFSENRIHWLKEPSFCDIRKKLLTDALFFFTFRLEKPNEMTRLQLTFQRASMIDLNLLTIEPSVLKLISKRTALELAVLPIAVKNDVVIIAVPPMFHSQVLTDIRMLLGNAKRIKPVSVSRDSIIAAIHRFYGTTDS
ncbi:MAG TPA: hypothetical protein DEP53_03690 [Bacteroidetes bacterium]|nr:hypothetical protein [Bacteroidota bacterium]